MEILGTILVILCMTALVLIFVLIGTIAAQDIRGRLTYNERMARKYDRMERGALERAHIDYCDTDPAEGHGDIHTKYAEVYRRKARELREKDNG